MPVILVDRVEFGDKGYYVSLRGLANVVPYIKWKGEITFYFDKIQEKTIAMQKLQKETEKEIERRKESILHKAFGGGL